jgi:EAL domain-containing protein (putative c-di-GMP-specific phosphodiesterase class I)
MNAALAIFTALDDEQLRFEWEPVRDAGRTGHTQYYEGLLCKSVGDVVEHAGSLVPALERVGLVRRLDQWVVETVIDTLRANREVSLGCNISAQSARLDAWWVFIVAVLSEERDIASRLVIEITETARFEDMSAAREFVRSLQSLGCRVALDDVGAGHSTLRVLVDLGVDIAKVDRAYVRKTGDDAVATERLGRLIGLARTCAKEVIVEGIESDSDAELARRSGASGLQGYLFSSTPVRLKPPAAWGRTQP